MNALIGLTGLGAGISLVLWLAAGWMVRPLVSGDRVLHLATIYLTVIVLVGLDLVIVMDVLRLVPTEILRLVLSAVMGIQVIASLSAVLFVRQVRAERA